MAGGGNFPPTRWSVVEAARSSDADVRARALDMLFAAYWKPVYKYIRLKYSQPPDAAQDLTQGFFVELLERDLLARFVPEKSRLRTYVRLCADSFVLNELKHAGRQKRGGDAVHLALDFSAAEGELAAQTIDPASIPSEEKFEEFFEKEWIRSLFSAAVEDLRQSCAARGKDSAFALFSAYDLAEDAPLSYVQLAVIHGISASDVTNQLAWARREFRRFAQERLRALCASEEEFARESKSLFGARA
ncbi:MAG TPA: sigma-70 family RNA polymerase sigma factor [Candidatus Acidoferrum sp.]|nr:sigma-70 family RNA polymerase sigma factor [Candidatus Acidoferrum sp.]